MPEDTALVSRPCRSRCRWRPDRQAGSAVFSCSGCGSQWVPGLGWTPADADGTVPAEVLDAVRAAEQASPPGR